MKSKGEPGDEASKEDPGEGEEMELTEEDMVYLKSLVDRMPDVFIRAAEEGWSEEELIRAVFVGDCPACDGEETFPCDEEEGIEDPTVGMCRSCGYIWCTECGMPLERGEECGHWDICDECTEEKDENEDCGMETWECPNIIEWIARVTSEGLQDTCAWCGTSIPEDDEVFGIGGRIKGDIKLVGEGGTASFFPVAVGGRVVPAIATAAESQAKKEGNDIMFMVCGPACAEKLTLALKEEKEAMDRIELN